MTYTLEERICPVCGKKFIPAQLHVYRVELLKPYRKQLACSWKCVMDGERQTEQQRQRRRRVTGTKR